MFGFLPPPTPQAAPTPCPRCAAGQAVSLYATARTEYFRCVSCEHIWNVTQEEDPAPSTIAA